MYNEEWKERSPGEDEQKLIFNISILQVLLYYISVYDVSHKIISTLIILFSFPFLVIPICRNKCYTSNIDTLPNLCNCNKKRDMYWMIINQLLKCIPNAYETSLLCKAKNRQTYSKVCMLLQLCTLVVFSV